MPATRSPSSTSRPAPSAGCRPTGLVNASSGFGFDRETLDAAGAGEASAFAAVTSGDNSNILCARIARETYEIANVVARIYDPRRAEIFQRLGIPTVPTVAWTIDHVLRRMLPERGVAEWSDSTGTLHVVERPLPVAWEGKRIPAVMEPGGARVISVTRAGIPSLDVERPRRAGGRRAAPRGRLRRRAARRPVPRPGGHGHRGLVMKVAIAGAGNVGRYLAEDLALAATTCSSSSRTPTSSRRSRPSPA